MTIFTTINEHKLETYLQNNFNIIAVGCSRGGTTMVASLLYYLGYIQGDRISDISYEDLDFVDTVMEPNTWAEVWPQLIHKNTEKYKKWSLKLPAATLRLDIFEHSLKYPIFIVSMRNVLDITESLIKYDVEYRKDTRAYVMAYNHFKHFYDLFYAVLITLKSPVIFVNYEAGNANRKLFIEGFCSLFKIPFDEHMVNDALEFFKAVQQHYKEVHQRADSSGECNTLKVV